MSHKKKKKHDKQTKQKISAEGCMLHRNALITTAITELYKIAPSSWIVEIKILKVS